MKKYSIIILSTALTVSSCTTGAGSGAYAGSSLGSVLGSAIGGIIGGPRGSDVGTIVGMAGGAAVGAAVGNAAEQHMREEQHDALAQRNQRIQRQKARDNQQQTYNSNTYGSNTYGSNTYGSLDPSKMIDTSNSGDDRIDFGPATPSTGSTSYASGYRPSISSSQVEQIYSHSAANGNLTIRNVRFNDEDGDGKLGRNETGQVTFEIYNDTQAPIYDFDPTVVEADDNKQIYISPSVRVENIMPGQGLRYTATVKAGKRIKDGLIKFMVSAQKDAKPISYVTVVKVETRR